MLWSFTRISPSQGPWGTRVRLYGYGFTRDVKVYYDGQILTPKTISRSVILVVVPKGSRSAWFEISLAGRTLRAPVLFRVKNRPRVSDLTPRSGPPGIWVTVKGEHLPPTVRFWIGRTPVRREYVNDRTVRVLIHPGLRAGALSWAVGRTRHRSRLRFVPSRYPTLVKVTPSRGYFGDTVTLEGVSFCRKARVFLGGKPVKVVRRVKGRRIVIRIPKSSRTGRIQVGCFGKRFAAPGSFLVVPPYAKAETLSPVAGKAGRWVAVLGSGFRSRDRFWLGNRRLRIRFRSARRVEIFVPVGAGGGSLFYESFGRRFRSELHYTVYRKPVITAVQPAVAWYDQVVTLRGRNFCPMAKVRLAGRPLPVIGREGSGALRVQVPRGVRGGRFTVTCLKWTVRAPATLRISAPKAGVRKVSATVVPPSGRLNIEGFNLRPTDRFFLGRARLPMTYESATRVTVTMPSKPTTGVLIHQSFGRRVQTRFRIRVGWPKPELRGFSPKVAWYGQVVSLRGKGICEAPAVRLSGRVVPVVNASPTEIQVTIPKGARAGRFQVSCPGHRVAVPGALRLEAPFAGLVSIFPKKGPWGTWITLTGKNLRPSDRYYLGRTLLQRRVRISETEVRVKVPRGASSGRIAIVTRGRRVVTEHAFTLVLPVPLVQKVSPRKGWWGDSVEIRGRHFCAKPVVRFGRRVAFDVRRISDKRLRTTVPKRVYSGRVEVRCFGKVGRWAQSFRIVKPQPRIVDLFPDRGAAARWIKVSGHNLDRVQKAWLQHRRYGRVELVVKHVGKTQMQLFVPAGCKGGALVISAYGKRKTTSFSYFVPRKYR